MNILNNKYIFSFALPLITVSLTNCKKDSTTTKTNSQLLTQQSWKLIAYRYNLDNLGWQDVFSNMNDCAKDDKLYFQPNFEYTINDDLIKCYSWNPQILRQGTWSFDSNESKLIMGDTIIGIQTLEINVLNETNLKTTLRNTSGSTTSVWETTYVH